MEHDAYHQLLKVKNTIKGVPLDETYKFNKVFELNNQPNLININQE